MGFGGCVPWLFPFRGKSATHLPAVRALKMADDEIPYHGNTEPMS